MFGQDAMQKDYLNLIPASPTSASLAKLVDIPVSEYTGTAKTNIPIYTIDYKGYKMPITLEYSTNGIKVDQVASWVGLGWSLNIGGIVTRTVRGVPDDRYEPDNYYPSYGLFYSGSQINTLENGTQSQKLEIGRSFSNGVYENEPDIFYFKVPGYSGKFFFDEHKNVHLTPIQNIEIDFEMENQSPITSFTVITPDGVKYIFDEIESVETNLPRDYEFNSTWYLTKIETNYGDIQLSYNDEDILEKKLPGELMVHYDNSWHHFNRTVTTPEIRFHTKRLYTISWAHGSVVLISNHLRQDVSIHNNDNYPAKALSKINVYNMNSEIIKSYQLEYSYFDNSSGINTDAYLYKRLRLDKIKELDSNGLNGLPYSFSYNSINLPPRNSTEQDYWGYYNDNNETTLVPDIYFYPSGGCNNLFQSQYSVFQRPNYSGVEYFINVGADRSADTTSIKAGILEELTFPTGGKTKYYYESNKFNHNGTEITGGGLRIQKIDNYDGATLELTKQYKYNIPNSTNSSGIVLSIPNFAYQRTSRVDEISSYQELITNTFFFINNLSDMDSYDNNSVIYEYVTVEKAGNGSIIKKFDIPEISSSEIKLNYGDSESLSISRLSPENNGGYYLESLYPDGMGTVYWHLRSTIPINDYYPYQPIPIMSWCIGQILEENFYKTGETSPIKTIKYKYQYKQVNYQDAFTVSFYEMNPQTIRSFYNQGSYINAVFTYDIIGHYTNMVGRKELISKETINILSNIEVSQLNEYDYNYGGQLSEISKIMSNGQIFKETFKYPSDFKYSLFPLDMNYAALLQMKTNNIINKPVEIVKYVDGEVVESVVLKHKIENNLIVIDSVLNLNINSPITNYTSLRPLRSNVIRDSRMQMESVEKAHDIYGNVLEYETRDGLTTTLTYSHNGQYPKTKTISGSDGASLTESWTWKPLVGITSHTDVKGVTVFYNYDNFGRLVSIKNDDEELVESYEYHFKE